MKCPIMATFLLLSFIMHVIDSCSQKHKTLHSVIALLQVTQCLVHEQQMYKPIQCRQTALTMLAKLRSLHMAAI